MYDIDAREIFKERFLCITLKNYLSYNPHKTNLNKWSVKDSNFQKSCKIDNF